jgi:integrase
VTSKVRSILVPAFRGKLVCEVVRRDIGRYIADRERRVSVATRNRDLAVLSSMFRKAIEMGYAETNPVRGIGRPQEAILPVPYIDQAGQRRLIEACDQQLRPLVVLALDTGMRVGELLRLEWRDVDRVGRVATVRAPKNKQPRTIPYGARAAQVLSDLFDARVIPIDPSEPDRVLAKIPTAWTGRWYGRYQSAVKAAELPPLRFHDLRHVYAVDLVRAGVPLPDVAKLLGHKTLTMTMRYASHAPKDATYRARDMLEEARRGDTPDAVRESA